MSGNEVANLEELANARLRVTAVILPQYNPIRPRLKPPLVEPRRFHSSASLFSPFARHRDFDPLLVSPLVSQSFRRCTAPITSGAPHPRRYASALFSLPRVPLSSPRPPSPRPRSVALSYSVFYFFPRHPTSCRALASSILPPLFLSSAIFYSAPWE